MKDVQCYELLGGIALKNHAFSFFSMVSLDMCNVTFFSFSISFIVLVMFVEVCSAENEIARLSSCYTAVQLEFYKKLVSLSMLCMPLQCAPFVLIYHCTVTFGSCGTLIVLYG